MIVIARLWLKKEKWVKNLTVQTDERGLAGSEMVELRSIAEENIG